MLIRNGASATDNALIASNATPVSDSRRSEKAFPPSLSLSICLTNCGTKTELSAPPISTGKQCLAECFREKKHRLQEKSPMKRSSRHREAHR